jgi:hypothetical protein
LVFRLNNYASVNALMLFELSHSVEIAVSLQLYEGTDFWVVVIILEEPAAFIFSLQLLPKQ